MKVLVTGADGMLGSNIVRRLLDQNHDVRVMILPGSPSKSLTGLDIETREGNILNPLDAATAVKGCQAVIHTAANTNIWPDRSEIVRKVNYDGTVNMVQAAQRNNIERFIFIGTANSFGFGTKEDPGDETRPYKCEKYGLDYMDSKLQAQNYVLNEVKTNGFPALTVNPTFMWGPYDSKPGAGEMILAVYKGKVPGYAVGGRNYVHANDVALAVVNALSKGRIGESYIGGHHNMDYKEAFDMIAKVVGVKAPPLAIPPFAGKLYGRLGSLYGTIFNKKPNVSYAMAHISCDGHYFTADKAVKELDMPQTSIEVAIEDCFKWLKDNGYLEK